MNASDKPCVDGTVLPEEQRQLEADLQIALDLAEDQKRRDADKKFADLMGFSQRFGQEGDKSQVLIQFDKVPSEAP